MAAWRQIIDDGKRLNKEGRYFEAEQALRPAIEADCAGSSERDKAEIYLEYARALQKLARYEECERFIKEAQKIYRKESRESFEFSECLNELGMLCYEQDDTERAISYYQQALKIRRNLYPSPHAETANVLRNLGEAAWTQGDLNTAGKYLQEALDMQRQTIGEEHEEYADTLGDWCLVLLGLHKYEEAEAGMRRALEIREATLSADHASIGNNLCNLAHALLVQGKSDGVEDMMKRSVDIAIKSYGEDSPRTAICINNLGGFHLDKGNLNEAARNFERSLAIKERILGKNSPAIIKNLNNLAAVYSRLGRNAEAQNLRARSGTLMRSKLEGSDKKDIDTMIFLSDKLVADRQHDEAALVLEQALDVAKREFGENSLKAAQVLNLMGAAAHARGDVDKAKDYYIKVLNIRKKQHGKKHPKVAETLRSVSTCLLTQGLRDHSAILTAQAQAIEFASGLEDPELAAMRMIYNQRRDAKGERDPHVLQTLRMLAEMYNMRGQTEEGNALFDEYLQARIEEEGETLDIAHELVTKASSSLPITAFLMGQPLPDAEHDLDEDDVRRSLDMLERAAKIQERALEESADTEELCSTLGQMSSIYSVLKNYEKAESVARRSLEVCERHHGQNHHALAVPLLYLKNVLEAQGKQEEAEAVSQRREALPQATREERDASMRRLTERMFGSMGRMLQELTSIAGTGGGEESESSAEDTSGGGGSSSS